MTTSATVVAPEVEKPVERALILTEDFDSPSAFPYVKCSSSDCFCFVLCDKLKSSMNDRRFICVFAL